MPLIAAKDPEAFEVFYDRHGGVAYSLAYRIVGERAAAEDVIQEAFISIWRSGARYDRARGSVRSWMLGIVRNRAIDAAAQPGRQGAELDFDDDAILEQRLAGERTEDEAMRARDRRPRSAARSASCRGEQSKVIELAYFGGFSQSEIAEMLGVPLGTVKGTDAAGVGEDAERAGGGAGMSEADHTRWRTTSPPTCWARSSRTRRWSWSATSRAATSCRAELRWLRPAVDLLPSSVERVEPPPELRAKVLDQARSEPGPAAASAERPRAARRAPGCAAGGRSPRSGPVALRCSPPSAASRSAVATRGEARRRTVAAGKSPGVTAKVVSEGDSRHPAPRQRQRDARRTRCSRPGCSAKARSNRSARPLRPRPRGPRDDHDPRHARGRSGDGHHRAAGRQRVADLDPDGHGENRARVGACRTRRRATICSRHYRP